MIGVGELEDKNESNIGEFRLGRLRDSVADFRELVRFWKQL